MKVKLFLISTLLLLASTAACAAQKDEVDVSNFRTAHDSNGENVTTTFSQSDVIYAVIDLARAPRNTKLEVKWITVDAEGTEPNHEFDSQTINITNELFTGTTYFQLSNAAPWPVGKYRVDLYVNDSSVESVEFSIQ
ncbi:MAG TPA: hypothetical protein VE131_10805 [Terriglobales bacterium]|nr:hypothetical protein [Terriglobales bacterium]